MFMITIHTISNDTTYHQFSCLMVDYGTFSDCSLLSIKQRGGAEFIPSMSGGMVWCVLMERSSLPV